MILEAELENKLSAEICQLDALSAYQTATSRSVPEDGALKDEEDKTGVIAIAAGFRSNDAFSLPMITVPVTFQICTRLEADPTGKVHENAVEQIANLLSYWHKYPTQMQAHLEGTKYSAGELTMNGGSGRTCDKTNKIWSEDITFSIRGSEKFV